MIATRLELPRSAPSEAGVSASAVLAFVDEVEERRLELHSLMLLRHGQVAAEGWWAPYLRETPHLLYSLSKSFTSTAIGLAIHQGRLALDDAVISFFPNETPAEPSSNLRAMRVRDLLTMSCGQDADDLLEIRLATDGDWPRVFLARPVPFEPGTHFFYNSSATFMLSAILQRLTGETLTEYLTPRLFEPLGIAEPVWEKNPQGIDVGGWGLSLTTEAIAKFGQLYLQRGIWEGQQLVPADWVDEATKKQVSNGTDPDNDWNQGYGYQFWRSVPGCYRGDGAFGQYCIVVPDLDMVVAITASVNDMGAAMRLIWKHLLPSATAPTDPTATEELAERLADLTLPGPLGKVQSEVAPLTSGVRFEAAESETGITSFQYDFQPESARFTAWDDHGEHSLEIGLTNWATGSSDLDRTAPPKSVAAQGAWVAEDTFEFEIKNLASPESTTIRTLFSGSSATSTITMRGRFGPCGPWIIESRAVR